MKSENQIKKGIHTSDFKNSRNKIYATELKPSNDRPSLIESSEHGSMKHVVKGFGNIIDQPVLVPC